MDKPLLQAQAHDYFLSLMENGKVKLIGEDGDTEEQIKQGIRTAARASYAAASFMQDMANEMERALTPKATTTKKKIAKRENNETAKGDS